MSFLVFKIIQQINNLLRVSDTTLYYQVNHIWPVINYTDNCQSLIRVYFYFFSDKCVKYYNDISWFSGAVML